MDIAEIKARKQPRRKEVAIILDADLELRLTKAEATVEAARNRLAAPKLHPDAAKKLGEAMVELDEARAAAADATQVFVFQALGRQQFSDLQGEHPPTKEQRAEWTKRWLTRGVPEHRIVELDYNPDTFPPVLIAAACIEPAMTVDDATEIWTSGDWSDAELGELLAGALLVNQQHGRHDLGNG